MPGLLHLDTLHELYPEEQERRAFAQRARVILLTDRLALQKALAGNAYDTACGLVHRLQGSVSFLSVSAEATVDALRVLSQALQCRSPDNAQDCVDGILRYLRGLEDELAQVAQPDASKQRPSAPQGTY